MLRFLVFCIVSRYLLFLFLFIHLFILFQVCCCTVSGCVGISGVGFCQLVLYVVLCIRLSVSCATLNCSPCCSSGVISTFSWGGANFFLFFDATSFFFIFLFPWGGGATAPSPLQMTPLCCRSPTAQRPDILNEHRHLEWFEEHN